MWHARNVKDDKVGGIRFPVWISDVRFLDIDRPIGRGWKVVVGTKYGDIRIYDTATSTRPIINVQVSCSPITSVCYGLNDDHVLYTNSQDTIGVVNVNSGRFNRVRRCISGTAWVCASDRGSGGENGIGRMQENDGRVGQEMDENLDGLRMDIDINIDGDSGEDDKNDNSDSSYDSSEDEIGGDVGAAIVGSYGRELANESEEAGYTLIDSLEPSSRSTSVLPTPLDTSTPISTFDSESRLVTDSGTSSATELTSTSISGSQSTTTDTVSHSSPASKPIYVTGGIDNTLRIYNLNSNKLFAKAPVNSRFSSILILDSIDPSYSRSMKRSSSSLGLTSHQGCSNHICDMSEPQSKRQRRT